MESIIKKAIEGGWKPFGSVILNDGKWGVPEVMANFYHQPTYILDPLFWKSLGKVCGWKESELGDDICFLCGYKKGDGGFECEYSSRHRYGKDEYKKHAIKFYKINLTEGWDKAVAYLEDLIK